jgi:hypothetical protein
VQRRLAGGCHFTRPIVDLLTTAGFTINELDVFYAEGTPKFAGASSLGTAVSPDGTGRQRAGSTPDRPNSDAHQRAGLQGIEGQRRKPSSACGS